MDLRFLDPNGQPTREAFNERFEFLSDFVTNTPLRIDRISNEYVWEKQGDFPTADLTGTVEQVVFGGTGNWFYYSAEYSISNGSFTLVNPQKYTLSKPDNPEDILKGKYFCPTFTTTTSATLYRFDADTFGYWTGTEYRWAKCSIFGNPRIEKNAISYANSPDPNAYPPAVDDGFTYKLLGRLGEATKIATGSYKGTGTYGSSKKNTLTFEFEPKMLIVIANKYSSTSDFLLAFKDASNKAGIQGIGNYVYPFINSSNSGTVISFDGNTVSWYGINAEKQLNYISGSTGYTYSYIAIG